jgi:1,2-diacylglycerol 3-beta-glucosyltransferase
MSVNSWPENDSYNELEALDTILADLAGLSEAEDEEPTGPPKGEFQGRRRKAAVVLVIIWSSTAALHLLSWGALFVLALTTLVGVHALRILVARPLSAQDLEHSTWKEAHPNAPDLATMPFISLLVAAKNEEAVIGNLVKAMCSLDYPGCRYELWVIDDNSTDQTPVLLDRLAQDYSQLKVLHRSSDASGGKSGALNQVLPLTIGDIIGVFDADAQISPDLLQHIVPLFSREQVGAIQVRKEIANVDRNLWTQGQAAEMALDTFFQQQRIAIGGIGELRGNGQFVRRTALLRCGGWNEETITDDLDLTLRLHFDNWDIDCLMLPAVAEEGVTTALALWHQRNRWAEGGYQRYLDFWQLLLRNRLGPRKTFDLGMFWIIQYALPTAAVPDCLLAIARHRFPMLSPVTAMTIGLSLIGMFLGLRRIQKRSYFETLQQTLFGTVYMLHWLAIVASVTTRMSVLPKRLKWVKTVHHGAQPVVRN